MTTIEPAVNGFLSPFEVPMPEGCEGWAAMYPYYALFSEERRDSEEARGWFRDGMHFPEPMFPFDFVTADSPYMCLELDQLYRELVSERARGLVGEQGRQ